MTNKLKWTLGELTEFYVSDDPYCAVLVEDEKLIDKKFFDADKVREIIILYKDSEHPINEILDAMLENLELQGLDK